MTPFTGCHMIQHWFWKAFQFSGLHSFSISGYGFYAKMVMIVKGIQDNSVIVSVCFYDEKEAERRKK